MQKEACPLLIWVCIPKALTHFALTTLCITCPSGFPLAEVEASGGEMWAEIGIRAVANGNMENQMRRFISVKVQFHNPGCSQQSNNSCYAQYKA